MNVVISQSMYFPWVGLLEQVRLADVFVHYDDTQFTRGFFNRVQVKQKNGTSWLTIPTAEKHRGQAIDEILVDESQNWRERHLNVLRDCYRDAPHVREMIALVEKVFSASPRSLADVSRESMVALAEYFDLSGPRRFVESRSLAIGGSKTQRLLDISIHLGASAYITGHGARNYLEHEEFEKRGIAVEYMNYNMTPYPQLYGAFTPYVSALDLVANCGREGRQYISSGTLSWKEFPR